MALINKNNTLFLGTQEYHLRPLSYTKDIHDFEDKDGKELYRQDADLDEINRMKADMGDGYYKVWREFSTQTKPAKWIVWPHSITEGWCERLEGSLP